MQTYQEMRKISLQQGLTQEERKHILESRYQSESTYRLPFAVGKSPAFIMLCTELQALISNIHIKNSNLQMLCTQIPPKAINQFRVNTLIEEIQQSNEVENVNSTKKEIRDAERAIQKGDHTLRFSGMVNKYKLLLNQDHIPLATVSDVRHLYDEFILDEVLRENKENAPDGTLFRSKPVQVYSSTDQILHEGLFPESKIIAAMEQALQFLNDQSVDLLVRTAFFHYAFAYIHPFYDGNGRMTRFISSYVLSGYIEKSACMRIAYVIKENRKKYYKMFKEANEPRNKGDLTRFTIEFLRFLEVAIDETTASLQEKKDQYEHYLALLTQYLHDHSGNMESKYEMLLDVMLQYELFGSMRFTIEQMSQVTECSEKTMRRMIEQFGPLLNYETEGRTKLYHMNLSMLESA